MINVSIFNVLDAGKTVVENHDVFKFNIIKFKSNLLLSWCFHSSFVITNYHDVNFAIKE